MLPVTRLPSVRTILSKRVEASGADTCFVTYDELSAVLPDCRDTVVKLEPPVFREADFRKYNLLCGEYRSLLSRLADMDKSESVHFLNEPAAILCALDKVYTQRKLTGPA